MASKSKKKSKTPTIPKSLRKGGLPRSVADVWAAGVGALAQARKTGGDSFEALVTVGTQVAETGSKAAKSAVEQVEAAAGTVSQTTRGVVGGATGGLQDRVENVVEGVLSQLGIPNRDEVLALRAQVDALRTRLAALAEAPGDAEPLVEAEASGKRKSPGKKKADAPAVPKRDALSEEPADTDRAVYEVATHERGWAIRREGAERATAVHATKKLALVDARQTARAHAPSRLVVYKADGTVGEETDYDG